MDLSKEKKVIPSMREFKPILKSIYEHREAPRRTHSIDPKDTLPY